MLVTVLGVVIKMVTKAHLFSLGNLRILESRRFFFFNEKCQPGYSIGQRAKSYVSHSIFKGYHKVGIFASQDIPLKD